LIYSLFIYFLFFIIYLFIYFLAGWFANLSQIVSNVKGR